MPKRPDIGALARNLFADKTPKPDNVHPIRSMSADEGRIIFIPLEYLEPDPEQPRQYFDEEALSALTESIREKGILQPIIARKKADAEGYIVISGERRYRASKAAGLAEIPALIRGEDDRQEVQLIENLQRENLSPLEEAEALRKLKDTKSYTLEDLGRIIGRSKQSVSETLKLLELPEDIQATIRESTDSRTLQKSQILQVVRAGEPEKVRAAWEALRAGEAPTVRALKARTAKPQKGRPKNFTHAYKPPHGRFRLTITFARGSASRSDIQTALEEALAELS